MDEDSKELEATEKSLIEIAMEVSDGRIEVGMIGGNNPKDIERLEKLAESAKKIGDTINVQGGEVKRGSKEKYLITLDILPEKETLDLLDILNSRVAVLNGAIRAYEDLFNRRRITEYSTEYDKYLGNWLHANPALRIMVGKDLETLYGIFEKKLGVSIEDVQSENKLPNIVFARAVISVALRGKYGKASSFPSIGLIMKKNHATVMNYINEEFKGLELERGDYQHMYRVFEKALPKYTGRKPKLRN